MARRDIVSNDFWKNPQRAADLLNVITYNGRNVIQPGNLQEVTPLVARTWWKKTKLKADFRITDVRYLIAKPDWTAKASFQNQTDTSYIMPVRNMDTESAAYYNQWKDIGMQHLAAGDLRPGGEFNSKFTKSDCLEGELTVVIYYGKKKWDGARRLKDFLPEALRRDKLQDLIADYPVNLVDVRNFPDTDKFQTDLRQVFHFMQKDNDREQLK